MIDVAAYNNTVTSILASIAKTQATAFTTAQKYRQTAPVVTDGVTWQVDEYVCPDKKCGYLLVSQVTIDKALYQRVDNVGPETWHAHPWRAIPVER